MEIDKNELNSDNSGSLIQNTVLTNDTLDDKQEGDIINTDNQQDEKEDDNNNTLEEEENNGILEKGENVINSNDQHKVEEHNTAQEGDIINTNNQQDEKEHNSILKDDDNNILEEENNTSLDKGENVINSSDQHKVDENNSSDEDIIINEGEHNSTEEEHKSSEEDTSTDEVENNNITLEEQKTSEEEVINEGVINFDRPYIRQYYSENVPVDDNSKFSIHEYCLNHDYDTYRDTFTERLVSFNDIKQINYFYKDEKEMDPKLENDDVNGGSAVDDEDDDYYEEEEEEYSEEFDEEEEEEEEDYSDEYDEDEEYDEYEDDEDTIQRRYRNKKIPFQKQRISNKFDVSSDEVDEDDDKPKEEDEDDDSYNSVEEHSDVENILEDSVLKRYINPCNLMNIRDSIDKTKLEKLRNEEIQRLSELNGKEEDDTLNSTPQSGLKPWALRAKPIKFVLSPNALSDKSQTTNTTIKEEKIDSEDSDEYQDDIDDMIIHDDIENDKLIDILNHDRNNNRSDLLLDDEDIDDEDIEKFMEISKSRSLLEVDLLDIRNRVEHERYKLKEIFTKATEDLKLSINNVSKYYDSSENGASGNELEEVSKSLIELEEKIIEIEESLDKTKQKQNSKPNRSQTKINSLLDEIVSLKEQIEKEKQEKMNQDIELKDITNHLLEMASQLSDTIINNSPLNIGGSTSTSLGNSVNNSSNNLMAYNSPNNSSFSTNNNNNNNTGMEELEHYRGQIAFLEKRLSIWKHHNDMLHLELLNGKQTNSEEILDLSLKINKVEEERDKLSLKIDELVQNKGKLEGMELIMSNKINNLQTDNQLLSETILEMQKDTELIQERFNQLIVELHEIGDSAVKKLQDIIDELVLERSELQSSIKSAEVERLGLVKELQSITDKLIYSEDSNQQLLSNTNITIKSLEVSELQCNDLQMQLTVVTKRLIWAESEVDRLTKEVDRIIKINISEKEELSMQMKLEHQKIQSSFSLIREQTMDIKQLLTIEKNEIIQLGSEITFILEKGKQNTSKTIKSLRDFVLKEVETTKIDINNRLSEIETNIIQNQDHTQIETNQILLNEMNQQKLKLNEMQMKIVKMESQINEISETNINNNNHLNINNDNNNNNNNDIIIDNNINNSKCKLSENNWERDQVVQLMKLENKIRKIEAGISEIIDYKSPPNTTPISTTTITTTTTTHHTYSNDNLEPDMSLSSPLFNNNTNPNIIIEESNLESITNNVIETLQTNGEDIQTTLENQDDLISDNIKVSDDNIPNVVSGGQNNEIKSIILDSILLGTSSILSNVFYQLMYHKSDLSPLSALKSSLKYGLIITSLIGIIKSSSLLDYKSQQKEKKTKTAPVDDQPKPNNIKNILISGAINASIFGGILYIKNKKPVDLLTGSLIGFANGLIINYKCNN